MQKQAFHGLQNKKFIPVLPKARHWITFWSTVALGYNVMKGAEYFVSLQTSVVLTKECDVTINSEKLIGTTEYLTLQTVCRISRCRYNRVRLYLNPILTSHPSFLWSALIRLTALTVFCEEYRDSLCNIPQRLNTVS
jgi:hypothetical protein